MTIKINLPETHVVTKGWRESDEVAEFVADVTKLPVDIVAELAMHGLHQKLADSAAGAESMDEATSAMGKVFDQLVAGEWTRRGTGGGVSEEQTVARMVTRRLVKAKFGSKSPEWATFTGLDAGEQNAKLDEWFASNEAALAPERDAELAARRDAAKRKRDAAKKVEFSL